MSTEILNPVTSASMMYPELGTLKPTKRFYQCPRCLGNVRTQLKVEIQKMEELVFGFECHECGKNWFISSKLILNTIFQDQLLTMSDYTKRTGKEFGGLIIKTENGLRIDMVQVGEEMSVSIGQTHQLNEKEQLAGTIHNHPYTDIPSDWDIATFLHNKWEQVSIVNGAKGTINVMVKCQETIYVEDVRKWCEQNQGIDFKEKGNLYKFIIYRGPVNNLQQITIFTNISPITSVEQLLRGI